MKRRSILFSFILLLLAIFNACDYLNIVPDNVATIEDNAFALRSDAKRFLITCYSYMPTQADRYSNPGFLSGDEIWLPTGNSTDAWRIARGNQRVVNPYLPYWSGSDSKTDLYEGIRKCNTFLENIGQVPDMPQLERKQWAAEVKFLKAYYLFYLVRMYGPVILAKKNIPVSTSREGVDLARSPVDDCFAYIVKLLNEAAPDLPDEISNRVSNLGRITKPIDYAIKAKVLVTAASPFFNGNKDYKGFTNKDGKELFNTEFEPAKWDSAAAAAKKAIDFAKQMGYGLYYFKGNLLQYDLSDTTMTKMNIRNSVAKKWNSEILWANTNSSSGALQSGSTPRGLEPEYGSKNFMDSDMAPPLKIVKMFYSNHGVPIKEDKTWAYSQRFDLKTVTKKDRFNLKEGYTTAKLNFNREPRFYADLGFDGGIWYGQGHYDDESNELLYVAGKDGQAASIYNINRYSVTGYYPKKLVNYQNVIASDGYQIQDYPWPVMRLADLYLLYSEAQNEATGPGPEVYKYINLVRKRAGLESVQKSWSTYSVNPNKYTTKKGMREIIHRERLIELAFEAKRFWALRRWKEAVNELNHPIAGWDVTQSSAKGYYRKKIIFNQKFSTKDYMWPISEDVLLKNRNLVQNPGWSR